MALIHDWETFYVIIGSSAAALTGLQFVVIALGSDRRIGGEAEIQAFATPTVVHFCAVLTIGAMVVVPGQTSASLSLCLIALGAAGVGYAAVIVMRTRRQTGYAPVLEDWLWHVGFPFIAYTALLVTAFIVRSHVAASLYCVGAIALFLLFIGIHNAWDAAVYISIVKRDEP